LISLAAGLKPSKTLPRPKALAKYLIFIRMQKCFFQGAVSKALISRGFWAADAGYQQSYPQIARIAGQFVSNQ
jgi:hypothetical protein